MTQQSFGIKGIFPCPVYFAHRNSDLDSSEIKDIEDIINEGIHPSVSNSVSQNNFIFDTKLKNLKEFCEQHIKKYAEEILNPKQELDFYITQSWLNISKPGESHHQHWHPNSSISGVFYIKTVKDDEILFHDPNHKIKRMLIIEAKEANSFNLDAWRQSVNTFDLLLFPSWLEHSVSKNKKATEDRISISFNTFVKGTLGKKTDSTELILK